MRLIFKIYADNKLIATEATKEEAMRVVKNTLYMWRHRTPEPFMGARKEKKPKMTIEKVIK